MASALFLDMSRFIMNYHSQNKPINYLPINKTLNNIKQVLSPQGFFSIPYCSSVRLYIYIYYLCKVKLLLH